MSRVRALWREDTGNPVAIASMTALGLVVLTTLLLARWGLDVADDGVVLASSRRLLAGQVPHRDFILTRPPLSPILHMPEVLLSGPYVFFVSRVVALAEFAAIALCIVLSSQRVLSSERRWSSPQLACLVAIAFFACINFFPLMAWHSLDAVALAAVGMLLFVSRSSEPSQQWAGALILGLSCLARQNFLLLAPIALLLFGGWRYFRNWIAFALPAAAYALVLVLSGAWADAVDQLTARTSFMETGVAPLLGGVFLVGVALGIFAGGRFTEWDRWRFVLAFAVVVGVLTALVTIDLMNLDLPFTPTWMPFGIVVGLSLGTRGDELEEWRRWSLLVAAIAWSSAISIGWNYPILFTGGLIVAMLTRLKFADHDGVTFLPSGRLLAAFVLLTVSLTIYTRLVITDFDAPMSELTFAPAPDCGVSGLSGIRTNRLLGAALNDLAEAKALARGHYAILPGLALNWATDARENPLPTDWADDCEIPSQSLQRRLTRAIDSQRGHMRFIISKRRPDFLFLSLTNKYSGQEEEAFSARYVRCNLTKVGQTQFFEVYE